MIDIYTYVKFAAPLLIPYMIFQIVYVEPRTEKMPKEKVIKYRKWFGIIVMLNFFIMLMLSDTL